MKSLYANTGALTVLRLMSKGVDVYYSNYTVFTKSACITAVSISEGITLTGHSFYSYSLKKKKKKSKNEPRWNSSGCAAISGTGSQIYNPCAGCISVRADRFTGRLGQSEMRLQISAYSRALHNVPCLPSFSPAAFINPDFCRLLLMFRLCAALGWSECHRVQLSARPTSSASPCVSVCVLEATYRGTPLLLMRRAVSGLSYR